MIELSDSLFWAFCAAGAVLFLCLRIAPLRPWILAALNGAFVSSFLGWSTLGLGVAMLAAYLCLVLLERSSWRVPVSFAIGTSILLIFTIHKLPLASSGAVGRVKGLLVIIGFSYVALRLVEVTRAVFERRHPAPSFPAFVNYVLPFHMLAAGPIQAYDDFAAAPSLPDEPNAGAIFRSVERIASGLFKKFVLAFIVQKTFLSGYEASGFYMMIEVQAAFLWLFLDFSAYSDIAVGVGGLIGVRTPENFNQPLRSRNIVEFWERWHISLSLFIRRNVFIPVQMWLMRRTGGRHALACVAVAISVAFLLCGLWHGFTWGCVLWGVAQASGLIAVRIYSQFLRRRLGADGVKRYLANRWIWIAGIFITFEFQAWALVPLLIG